MQNDKSAIKERIAADQKKLVEELKKTPIVQVACQRTGIGRATYYRWHKENLEFRKTADEAMAEGEGFVSDMSESQLITLIKEKNWSAIRFWLEKRNPKYASKLQIEGEITARSELTPEQREEIKRALSLMSAK